MIPPSPHAHRAEGSSAKVRLKGRSAKTGLALTPGAGAYTRAHPQQHPLCHFCIRARGATNRALCARRDGGLASWGTLNQGALWCAPEDRLVGGLLQKKVTVHFLEALASVRRLPAVLRRCHLALMANGLMKIQMTLEAQSAHSIAEVPSHSFSWISFQDGFFDQGLSQEPAAVHTTLCLRPGRGQVTAMVAKREPIDWASAHPLRVILAYSRHRLEAPHNHHRASVSLDRRGPHPQD